MKGAATVAAVALMIVTTLAVVGTPDSRLSPAPAAISSPTPPSVSANGVTLVSTEIVLPDDVVTYPAGPHADSVNRACIACHSPAMVLTQPKLSADQWKAEVTKMREVYKAPVPAGAVPDIVAYLTSLPAQRSGPR